MINTLHYFHEHHLDVFFGEYTMSTLFGLSAVGSAFIAVAGPMDGNPYIQYGALGLCAFMVVFLCRHISATHKSHREERAQALSDFVAERNKCMDRMDTITEKHIEAYQHISDTAQDSLKKMSEELRRRECLMEKSDCLGRLESALDRLDRKA